jgi:hypothetical protein
MYGGMNVSEAKRLRELEDENRRLKHIVADLTLDNRALKDEWLGRAGEWRNCPRCGFDGQRT